MRKLLMKSADVWGIGSHVVSFESFFEIFLFEPLCLLKFLNCPYPRILGEGKGRITKDLIRKVFSRFSNYHLISYLL